ncbi:hypothetical protein BOTBODRAFT_63384 [Botryobasidium botryosum FD-172 SS1]|uniref:F-box domain-containing protein n=1 Tax=Botryobasidium botryosum (strain FD-172 SS1) TaxID=930990 RepID=A0A067MRN9_BOTB1|nr:hypothetical protein BOTBODRAFT_63384 [Botryobasidium botryosum FD-172 SS1]
MQRKDDNGDLFPVSNTDSHRVTIHRLSAELLLEIFETAAEHFLRFSHVCGLWRRIIHGCSKFWSTIKLQAFSNEADQQAAYWILRAGGSLLSINVRACGEKWLESEKNEGNTIVPLASVLRPTMDRCKQLSISASPSQLDDFFRICAGHTSNLTELSVTIPFPVDFGDSDGDLDPTPPLYIPFTLPPNIEFPTRASINISGCLSIFSSFGASVTELIVGGSTPFRHIGDIMAMFESCPNLVKCSLIGPPAPRPGIRSVFRTVSLLRLVNLKMSGVTGAGSLLEYLNLPCLESLEVADFLWDDATRRTFWHLFQSCPSLSDFSVHGLDVNTSSDFTGPLLALHSITRFRFHCTAAYSLLRRLAFPNAQELRIGYIPASLAHHFASSSPRAHTVSFKPIIGSANGLPIIPFPTLISLKISGSIELLDHLHPLHLRSLSLSWWDAELWEPILLRFVEHSAPRLARLVLRRSRVSDQDLISCLERLPHLEDLHLDVCTTTDALLLALSVSSGSTDRGVADSSCLLPRLKRFRFYRAGFTAKAFIAFLLFRNIGRYAGIEGVPPRIEGRIYFGSHAKIDRDDHLKILLLGPYLD